MIDNLISLNKKKQKVSPVFKWGQSNEEIFMEIKLSHRFDSPGCIEKIETSEVDDIVQITEGNIDLAYCFIFA